MLVRNRRSPGFGAKVDEVCVKDKQQNMEEETIDVKEGSGRLSVVCDNNRTAQISFKNLKRVAQEFDERVKNDGFEEMTDEAIGN